VGPFEVDPSVDGRMRSFEASIEQMLWPEKRARDSILGSKVPGTIDRTTKPSYIEVSAGFLPEALQPLVFSGKRIAPWLFGDEGINVGPIPAGTPVGLLSNLKVLAEDTDNRVEHDAKLLKLVTAMLTDLRTLGAGASSDEAARVFGNLVEPLLDLSKCPDLVVNRGHYFGTDYLEPGEKPGDREPGLSDSDKRALIEFLKTF